MRVDRRSGFFKTTSTERAMAKGDTMRVPSTVHSNLSAVLPDPAALGIDLEADLHGAAARGELVAYFQPQVDLASGRVVAAEALCRWRHPVIGIVAPNVFIEIAERSNLINDVGAFMLQAGREFLQDCREFEVELDVAVNVSPSQLGSIELWNQLESMIHADAINPSKLTLEITESMEIQDVAAAAAHLAELRALGVGISIDDFGTGHSSVEQVVGLPVSEVKIDRSLVQGTSEAAREEFRDAMTLAMERDLRVVAEGIETQAQRDYAIEMGCQRGQGYLFGRPSRTAELAAWR